MSPHLHLFKYDHVAKSARLNEKMFHSFDRPLDPDTLLIVHNIFIAKLQTCPVVSVVDFKDAGDAGKEKQLVTVVSLQERRLVMTQT